MPASKEKPLFWVGTSKKGIPFAPLKVAEALIKELRNENADRRRP